MVRTGGAYMLRLSVYLHGYNVDGMLIAAFFISRADDCRFPRALARREEYEEYESIS